MNMVLIAVGLLLGAGLLVCLGLFLELKREIHVLRKAVTASMAQFVQTLPPAIRIPIDPLPLPRAVKERKNAEVPSTPGNRFISGEPEDRISSDEARLRARLRELRPGSG